MSNLLILCGAGAAGGYAMTYLRSAERIPTAFVDSNPARWGTEYMGIPVMSLSQAWRDYQLARYVVTVLRHDYAMQIREQLRDRGIEPESLDSVLPAFREIPPQKVAKILSLIVDDDETYQVLLDQYQFRKTHNYEKQNFHSPVEETYFPEFLSSLSHDEVFVDVGAAAGDTLEAFLKWSKGKYRSLIAIEPDPGNFNKIPDFPRLVASQIALSDHDGYESFLETGSWNARLDSGGELSVQCKRLDHLFLENPPTFIKMDIEGSELEALWGARNIIREHSPVLAICAYHEASHLWDIPLLIYAINPEYHLRLRRYAEGSAELVWYGIPESRVKP